MSSARSVAVARLSWLARRTFPRPVRISVVIIALLAVVSVTALQLWRYAELRDIARFAGFLFACLAVAVGVWAISPLKALLLRLTPWKACVLAPFVLGTACMLFSVFGELADQPYLRHLESYRLRHAADEALRSGCLLGVTSVFFVLLDFMRQPSVRRDVIYFPTYRSVMTSLRTPAGRLLLVLGVSIVCVYYGLTVARQAHDEHFGGFAWPPKRVFLSCMLLWGVLWVVDCWARPHKGTIVAAVGFLAVFGWITPLLGFGFLRE